MPLDVNKAPSTSIGLSKDTVGDMARTRQTIAHGPGEFGKMIVGSAMQGLSAVGGTMAAFLPGGAVIAASAQQLGSIGSRLTAQAGTGINGFRAQSSLAGNTTPHETQQLASQSNDRSIQASNNGAVLGRSPSFMSILQDTGTGGPGAGLASTAGIQSKQLGGGSTGLAMGMGGFSSNQSSSNPIPAGNGASFSASSMGSMGSALTATGAGAGTLPTAGSAMGMGSAASATTGGDSIAGQASATGGGSQAQLMQATQGMQEMQMSFNMQYLQLQNSMQNDNRQFTMVSNIMKTKHDTVKNTISNIH